MRGNSLCDGKAGKKVSRKWTEEEVVALVAAINAVPASHALNWAEIAKLIPERTGKQCREKYKVSSSLQSSKNDLRPEISKAAWIASEEFILARAHSEVGNQWAEIAKFLPGRSENSIKNHWNATLRSKAEAKSRTLLWTYGRLVHQQGGTTSLRTFHEAVRAYQRIPDAEPLCCIEVPEAYFLRSNRAAASGNGTPSYAKPAAPLARPPARKRLSKEQESADSDESDDNSMEDCLQPPHHMATRATANVAYLQATSSQSSGTTQPTDSLTAGAPTAAGPVRHWRNVKLLNQPPKPCPLFFSSLSTSCDTASQGPLASLRLLGRPALPVLDLQAQDSKKAATTQPATAVAHPRGPWRLSIPKTTNNQDPTPKGLSDEELAFLQDIIDDDVFSTVEPGSAPRIPLFGMEGQKPVRLQLPKDAPFTHGSAPDSGMEMELLRFLGEQATPRAHAALIQQVPGFNLGGAGLPGGQTVDYDAIDAAGLLLESNHAVTPSLSPYQPGSARKLAAHMLSRFAQESGNDCSLSGKVMQPEWLGSYRAPSLAAPRGSASHTISGKRERDAAMYKFDHQLAPSSSSNLCPSEGRPGNAVLWQWAQPLPCAASPARKAQRLNQLNLAWS
ncbi:hypothetical protein QJQ45_030013 [Haematococcus lacustris]|nr:hypothetical protein QJQ45_030013 [Haematococcus lacustris]